MIVAIVAGAIPSAAGPLDGWSSPNVTFIRNVARGDYYGTIPVGDYAYGAQLYGRFLYVVGGGLTIFDVSNPEDPEELSYLPVLGPLNLSEDPDTNGRILVSSVGYPETDLLVIDVSDPTDPQEIVRAAGLGGHTVTCVARCSWVYSSEGSIIDLRDPADPKLAGNWCEPIRSLLRNPQGVEGTCSHDVTEVAPGRLLTATVPMFLFDVRDPVNPKVIAKSDGSPYSWGGVVWPRRGRDRWVLSFSEAGGIWPPSCTLRNAEHGTTIDSGFKTWDASRWKSDRILTGGDEYFASDGTFTDGNPPASTGGSYSGCANTWFDVHPRFKNGGLIVTAAAGNGAKFLEIDRQGAIEEVGYWLPKMAPVFGSISALWITDEIAYVINIADGIDVLRFRTPAE